MNPIGAEDHEYAMTHRMIMARAALPAPSPVKEPVTPRPVLNMNMTMQPLGLSVQEHAPIPGEVRHSGALTHERSRGRRPIVSQSAIVIAMTTSSTAKLLPSVSGILSVLQ